MQLYIHHRYGSTSSVHPELDEGHEQLLDPFLFFANSLIYDIPSYSMRHKTLLVFFAVVIIGDSGSFAANLRNQRSRFIVFMLRRGNQSFNCLP